MVERVLVVQFDGFLREGHGVLQPVVVRIRVEVHHVQDLELRQKLLKPEIVAQGIVVRVVFNPIPLSPAQRNEPLERVCPHGTRRSL
jgi:hypothetical protein